MSIKGLIETGRKYSFLLRQLVTREIKLKYQRSILGILWSVLNPLLMMMILNVVFSKLFRMQIPNFLVYYLTGSLLFGFMQEATGGSLLSIIGNAGMIKKVYVPKYIFPAAKTTSAFVNFLFSLIALTLVGAATGVRPSPALLALPLLFAAFFVFVTGLSLVFAAYAVFFRDLVHLHGILMMVWMYVTPVFYPVKLLEDSYPLLVLANPIYPYVRGFREIVLDGRLPPSEVLLAWAGLAAASLATGVLVFRKKQDRFILYF